MKKIILSLVILSFFNLIISGGVVSLPDKKSKDKLLSDLKFKKRHNISTEKEINREIENFASKFEKECVKEASTLYALNYGFDIKNPDTSVEGRYDDSNACKNFKAKIVEELLKKMKD